MELLRVEHLSKIYGAGENQVKALDDVSLSVEKGEFVAIVGASGSGKSTLLHLLGGVDRPTSGKVYINGTDIFAMNDDELAIFRRRQVGLIYQFYNLIPILNVKENITLPCELDGRTPDKKELCDLINTLGLKDRVSHLPNQLSGGQQQRVAIARAVVTDCKLLLADEPTGNLDSVNGIEVMELLSDLNRQGTTVIIVTHSQRDAMYAHRVIQLLDGQIVAENINRPMEKITPVKNETL